MGSFGEELRKERQSRGIALEDISTITKISHRYLVALEEDKFRLLPGGILSKGIVRGYAKALELDPEEWTERFLRAVNAAGTPVVDDERGWATFASNVGKARLLRREAVEVRLRWIGAIILLVAVTIAAFFSVRYYGARAGWWHSFIQSRHAPPLLRTAWTSAHGVVARVLSWI
jgi:cytoskeletal protein RodZ